MKRDQMSAEERYSHLTTTPIPQLIAELSIPTIISMLVTTFYNMADTFFVGRISTQATAAVGIVFSVMALIQAIGFFCGHGSGNYLSRKLGAGEYREANEMASTGFVLAFLFGLIVTILGLIFLEPLAHLLGATPSILEDTKKYMGIILLGAPIMTSQLVINNQLRFQGAAAYAMVGLVTGSIVNIVLDPILIFGAGMGIRGAAVATVSSQILSFIILLAGSFRGANIRLSFHNVRINAHYLLEITNGGAPSLFRQGLASIATILLNIAAGNLGGDAAIAGMSIVNRIMMFAGSALIGFGQGYQPVCAFNYGAGLFHRVREGFFFCVKIATVFLLAVAVLGLAFAPQLVQLFRDDEAVIAIGTVALRYQMFTLPLLGFIIMSNMMLQSIGKGLKASVLASARNGIFFIPFILLLPLLFGIRGVELTQSCADICSFVIALPLVRSTLLEMKSEK